MSAHFCTITTADHLFKTRVLRDSIVKHHPDGLVHVLLMDAPLPGPEPGTVYYGPDQLREIPGFEPLRRKYPLNSDRLRWSLKSVFLSFLLNRGVDKVIYLDNDCWVVAPFTAAFDQLDSAGALLTPHYYPFQPDRNQNWLEANFRVGLYNAGFVAVNREAQPFLDWWAGCCAYRCEKNYFRGLFDDQKYLDLAPVVFPQVKVLRHMGYNLAGWNKGVTRTGISSTNGCLNDGTSPVFIHYNYYTIRMVEEGEDPELYPYWQEYYAQLNSYLPGLKKENLYRKSGITEKIKLYIWNALNRINRSND